MLQLKAFSSIGNKMLILLSGLAENEKSFYGISDAFASVKYSHTLIQQMLLYMALADSNGIVHIVLEDELAKEMDCSVRTIQHNNKRLTEAGVIGHRRICVGCIQITLQDYLHNVLDLMLEHDTTETEETSDISSDEIGKAGRFKSKRGYTIMSAERVRELVNLKDVNALRIALRFYRVLEKEVQVSKQEHAYVSYDEFKRFLPKYLHFPKAINELSRKVKGLFDLETYKTRGEVQSIVKDKIATAALAKRMEGGFLARLRVPEAKDSRKEKSKQIIELKEAFNKLRTFTFKTSDFHSKIRALSDGETKALISSFGINQIKKAINALEYAYRGTPISLEESDKPSLIQRFEFNPSLCLREIAVNF